LDSFGKAALLKSEIKLVLDMKKMNFSRLLSLAAAITLLLAAGCSSTKPAAPKTYTYFPPAPDEPRIQFLTSFASDANMGKSRRFIDFIVGKQKPADPLVKPYGVAVHAGKIYVCDTVAYNLQVFDLKTKRASVFAPQGEGKMQLPINVTVDQDGTLYVADTGREQVLIYRPDGTYVTAMGRKDEMKPSDVAITADRLYITDLKNHAVHVFAKADRKRLFSIPVDSASEKGKLYSPTNLAVDESGRRLLVSDTGGNVVQVYDLDGKYLKTIGRQGVAPGLFARPKGVALDRQGLAYVVDAATQVVQIFDPEGRLLLFFGAAGTSTRGELVLPAAVAVDYDSVPYFQKFVAPGRQCEYLIYVTSQFGGQKVSVYGFLKQPEAAPRD
jgi:sugar lactone lactonase YvrE